MDRDRCENQDRCETQERCDINREICDNQDRYDADRKICDTDASAYDTKIRFKGIVHNILNDAPFIGAVIIANKCSRGCVNCINEHLKTQELSRELTARDIISEVKSNGLNQGIILSGLEWTEQPKDLVKLTNEALARGLEIIVYTHHLESRFFEIVPELKNKRIYIKFGSYDESLKCENNFYYGVKLATSNQYIKYFRDTANESYKGYSA